MVPTLKHRFAGRSALLLFTVVLAFTAPGWAARRPQLAPRYEHWLNGEVNYLITSDERERFFELPSDEARDQFIDLFWKVRDSDPNAPVNAFREEHYKRLAYANAHFGARNLDDGWRSDRGMVYITLGPPQQRQTYPETKYLRPLEIWFYQSTSSALPAHFYVVFFKPSVSEPYRLYSPYGDRPQKLVNTSDAINDDARAIKIISTDLNDEVAHIALSLIPGEPVDLKQPSPSLQSDVLLNEIREFRNLPANRELLSARRGLLQGVTHRVLLGEEFSQMALLAFRSGENEVSLHYLLRLQHPEDFTLAQQDDGRYYYSLQIEAELAGPDGKPIYRDEQTVSEYLTASDVAKVREKCLGVEGRLPAAPGKYELRLAVTNLLTKQSFRQTRPILIPDFDHPLGISQVFFAENAPPQRDASQQLPFSFAGVKLSPVGADNAVIRQGDPLRILLQLWEAPGDPVMLRGKTLNLNYLIGQLGSADKREEQQVIDRGTFDAAGNLLIGKDLRTDALAPGHYRLVISATQPGSSLSSYQSLNFEVADSSKPPAGLWRVIAPSPSAQEKAGIGQYRAGLCAIATQHAALAVDYLQRALRSGYDVTATYKALASAYRMQGNTEAAVEAEKKVAAAPAQPPLKDNRN